MRKWFQFFFAFQLHFISVRSLPTRHLPYFITWKISESATNKLLNGFERFRYVYTTLPLWQACLFRVFATENASRLKIIVKLISRLTHPYHTFILSLYNENSPSDLIEISRYIYITMCYTIKKENDIIFFIIVFLTLSILFQYLYPSERVCDKYLFHDAHVTRMWHLFKDCRETLACIILIITFQK